MNDDEGGGWMHSFMFVYCLLFGPWLDLRHEGCVRQEKENAIIADRSAKLTALGEREGGKEGGVDMCGILVGVGR